MSSEVTIITFGYLHDKPPPAHITLDLRGHFKDPHVQPELRYLTAYDARVRTADLATPGIRPLIQAAAHAVLAYRLGPGDAPVTIAVGCAGGRHRAATVGMELAEAVTVTCGVLPVLTHRDLDKPVVERQVRHEPEGSE